jgi:ankyrin repeat protein
MLEPGLTRLVRAIMAADDGAAARQLATSPALATARFAEGATRQEASTYRVGATGRYIYAGDTALHFAAAAYRHDIARQLIALGADVRARNRRGAEPLHYAADGVPDSPAWDPDAQAATIACLIAAGADPDATDKSGVAPLHRAVRTRCAAAVRALIEGGADPLRPNRNGSTPLRLAEQNTGRSGAGSPAAKAEQARIVALLRAYGES